jgi:hypothetical protein
MSTLLAREDEKRTPQESPFIPGALIVGFDADDRATLMRRLVASRFNRDRRAGLVYVGAPSFAEQLRAALPQQRVASGAVAMADVTARGGAYVHGFDGGDEESRYLALCMIRAAFYLIESRPTSPPFILALDGFTAVIEERRQRNFIAGLRSAIRRPAAFPVLGFESFGEIERNFGGALDLVMTVERNYVLRTEPGDAGIASFWSPQQHAEGAPQLGRGEALIVSQGEDSPGEGVYFRQERVEIDSIEFDD